MLQWLSREAIARQQPQEAGPERNHEDAKGRCDHDGAAAAPALRVVAKEHSSTDGPKIGNDRDDGGRGGGQSELLLQEGGIGILSAVRHAVKRGHQDDDIDEEPGTAFDGHPNASPDAAPCLTTDRLLMLPDGGLMHALPNEYHHHASQDAATKQ